MTQVDQAGVLANPAQAGALGELALQDGTGIRVPAVRDCTACLCFEKIYKFAEAVWQDFVVI